MLSWSPDACQGGTRMYAHLSAVKLRAVLLGKPGPPFAGQLHALHEREGVAARGVKVSQPRSAAKEFKRAPGYLERDVGTVEDRAPDCHPVRTLNQQRFDTAGRRRQLPARDDGTPLSVRRSGVDAVPAARQKCLLEGPSACGIAWQLISTVRPALADRPSLFLPGAHAISRRPIHAFSRIRAGLAALGGSAGRLARERRSRAAR